MGAITTESLVSMLALIGVVIMVSALLSGFVERSNLPQVAVFLLFGAVLGPFGVGLLELGLDSPVLRVVATLSLALVLFIDALTLDLREVKQHAKLAGAILGPGTLAAAAIMGVAGHYLLGLSPAHAAILAAALASTDPVLLRGLLRRSDLPAPARLGLRLESGLNDVVLLPIVLFAMALIAATGAAEGTSVPRLIIQMLVLGPGAGVVVALVAIGTLELMRRHVGVRRDYESLYSLGVCFAAFAAAEAMHGSGFLAAFAAGITIAAIDVEMCDCFREYGETTAEMLLMFTFVLLGSSLIWSGLQNLSLPVLLFAFLALAARPLSLFVTLRPMKLEQRSCRIIAWFGPRGLSTLLLVLVPVFAGTPGSPRLFEIASVVVLFSVLVHGGSLMAFGHRASRRKQPEARVLPAGPDEPTDTSEIVPAPEIMTAVDVKALIERGEKVRLLDVRSDRSYLGSEQEIRESVRIDPGHARRDVERAGVSKDAWAALFCT